MEGLPKTNEGRKSLDQLNAELVEIGKRRNQLSNELGANTDDEDRIPERKWNKETLLKKEELIKAQDEYGEKREEIFKEKIRLQKEMDEKIESDNKERMERDELKYTKDKVIKDLPSQEKSQASLDMHMVEMHHKNPEVILTPEQEKLRDSMYPEVVLARREDELNKNPKTDAERQKMVDDRIEETEPKIEEEAEMTKAPEFVVEPFDVTETIKRENAVIEKTTTEVKATPMPELEIKKEEPFEPWKTAERLKNEKENTPKTSEIKPMPELEVEPFDVTETIKRENATSEKNTNESNVDNNRKTFTEWTKNPEQIKTPEQKLEEARTAYIQAYKEDLNKKGFLTKKWQSLKDTVGFSNTTEEKNLPEKLLELKKAYDSSKVELGNSLYNSKKKELNDSGGKIEEITEVLSNYAKNEIFQKIILEEAEKLEAGKREKAGLLQKGVEKFLKWPKPARFAAITALYTIGFVAMPGSAVAGAGAIATYATTRFARSVFGGVASAATLKGFDKVIKDTSGIKKENATNELRKNFSINDGIGDLKEMEKDYESIRNKEKRARTIRIAAKTATAMAVGGGLSYGLGHLGSVADSLNHSTGGASSAWEPKPSTELGSSHKPEWMPEGGKNISTEVNMGTKPEWYVGNQPNGTVNVGTSTGGPEWNIHNQPQEFGSSNKPEWMPHEEGEQYPVSHKPEYMPDQPKSPTDFGSSHKPEWMPKQGEPEYPVSRNPEWNIHKMPPEYPSSHKPEWMPEKENPVSNIPEIKTEDIKVDFSSRGAIGTIQDLQEKLRAHPELHQSAVEQEIMKGDATKLAEKFGFYKPGEINESAMLMKGGSLELRNGDLVYHADANDTLGHTIELRNGVAGPTEEWGGKMFDYNGKHAIPVGGASGTHIGTNGEIINPSHSAHGTAILGEHVPNNNENIITNERVLPKWERIHPDQIHHTEKVFQNGSTVNPKMYGQNTVPELGKHGLVNPVATVNPEMYEQKHYNLDNTTENPKIDDHKFSYNDAPHSVQEQYVEQEMDRKLDDLYGKWNGSEKVGGVDSKEWENVRDQTVRSVGKPLNPAQSDNVYQPLKRYINDLYEESGHLKPDYRGKESVEHYIKRALDKIAEKENLVELEN